eukprot:CAMPEP_0185547404 /NCGR_PEP_ID=MMETSP1381-20130426/6101_1 /TAXON_ID=298111 /ORGANISM="Pavlova sp., Strain CCMP459" /LENGTH=54 /DNA_ID=CAMNT_0028159951 /DNA_START=93 /DNA_END=254 /DNA_ORIENTATION=+
MAADDAAGADVWGRRGTSFLEAAPGRGMPQQVFLLRLPLFFLRWRRKPAMKQCP